MVTPHVKHYSKTLKTVFKKGNSCGRRRKTVQVGRKTLGYKASLSRIKWERNECRLSVILEAGTVRNYETYLHMVWVGSQELFVEQLSHTVGGNAICI